MLFPLALFCLASTALCSPGTEVRPEKERVRKEDDVSLGDLQRLVQQQASAINTLQARLTATENQLNSMGSQLQTTQHKVEDLTKQGGALTQCPEHWVRFEDSCYVFLNDVVPWATAEVFCHLMYDSHILEVTTQAENDFIAGELRVKGLSGAWLGVNDLVKDGEWRINSNHQRAAFLPWGPGEPNDSTRRENGSGQDCVWMTASGKWDDNWCEDIYDQSDRPAVVCEKPLGSGG